MKLQTNIAKTSLLTAAMFAAGAFVALAQSQQAHAQTQHFYIGSGGGTDAVTASPGNKTSYDVYFNETDSSDADANVSTVVSVKILYDGSVFSSPVVTNLAAVADIDPAACQVSGNQPADVAKAADNLKISGFSDGDENETGSVTVGSAAAVDTDKIVSVTFAQICGPVFATAGEKRLFSVEFDVADTFIDANTTALGFAAANGGDFVVSTVDDIEATVTPQTFDLDLDKNNASNVFDAIMLARFVATPPLGRAAIDPAALTANVPGAAAKGDDIKEALLGAGDVLDVDTNNASNVFDAIMIARFLATPPLGRAALDPATLTANVPGAAAKGDDIKSAISALVP